MATLKVSVTAISCPVLMQEQQVMFWGDVDIFWTIDATLVVEELFCDLKILS